MAHFLCPFEKAILSAQAHCELSTRTVVAERMNAGCREEQAARDCRALFDLLKDRSRFALKTPAASAPLPFGKLMKVMVGGLRGLELLLHPEWEGAAMVSNIHALVNEAQDRYGDLESLPFETLVRSIVTEPGRRPAKKK